LDYSTIDDSALLRFIARADADALSALYDRYHRLVFSIARNAVGDQATAEEITLDVFTQVWQKAGTYRADRAKVSTWLTSITRYRAIDELRRRGSRAEQRSVAWADLPPSAEPTVGGPETVIELSMQRRRVHTAVAQLPDAQKEALGLAYFRGLSHTEIAASLDLPLGTVKTRIRLAMGKLRQLLADENPCKSDVRRKT
jgi:RNA polymerase sigma-70 factor (ECF subfamily)